MPFQDWYPTTQEKTDFLHLSQVGDCVATIINEYLQRSCGKKEIAIPLQRQNDKVTK